MWEDNLNSKLVEEIKEWEIPVCIFQEEPDHQAEFDLAKTYYDSIPASKKRFYKFEGAGHMAIAWDPNRYKEIMLNEVLK